MALALLAINWEPEIRGILVVLIMVMCLIGGTYLVMATNVGVRLGFMIVVAGLAGWMMLMAAVWWIYGIGLKGEMPSWKPAAPITIVRDGSLLSSAEVVDEAIVTDGQAPMEAAATVSRALTAQKWITLDEADPRRGQAAAASDDILQNLTKEFAAGEYATVAVYDRGGDRYPKINKSLDFLAFFHKPHYALVEVAPVIAQRTEPGRAPARPIVDTKQPHRYVVMIRDLGKRRQPAIFIAFGAGLIFALMCWLLHRRDQLSRINRAALNPADI
ncbi:MAG: hypothetical protein EXQ63_00295 [Ilumatobacteraceae bacterium]|nr:hypothetical protein [Ilumatobacteraceae bacterium]